MAKTKIDTKKDSINNDTVWANGGDKRMEGARGGGVAPICR